VKLKDQLTVSADRRKHQQLRHRRRGCRSIALPWQRQADAAWRWARQSIAMACTLQQPRGHVRI